LSFEKKQKKGGRNGGSVRRRQTLRKEQKWEILKDTDRVRRIGIVPLCSSSVEKRD
jgi:hypothetical protein